MGLYYSTWFLKVDSVIGFSGDDIVLLRCPPALKTLTLYLFSREKTKQIDGNSVSIFQVLSIDQISVVS